MKNNPYIVKKGEILTVTPMGYEHLEEIVTDARGPVYAFTKNADPLIVAAAMARLSRRGSDLREIYLDEFADVNFQHDSWARKILLHLLKIFPPKILDASGAKGLIQRAVTGYGDESLMQLIFVSIVVEDASNLLTKLLEWIRLAAFLEQSTRYIYFDQVDENGNYKFFTPMNLPNYLVPIYRKTMHNIFVLYSQVVRELTQFVRNRKPAPEDKQEKIAWLGATRAEACDAARGLLPVATKATVGIVATSQSIQNLILHLSSSNLIEAQTAGKNILREARKIVSVFLERTDMPRYGGAAIVYRKDNEAAILNLAKKYLPTTHMGENSPVTLLDYWPKDELSIVPEILFKHSKLPLHEIEQKVSCWSIEKKLEVFNAYVGNRLNYRQKPGRALEKIHYEWQIFGRYAEMRDLQRHRIVDLMEWQRLTTKLGYEIPKLVTEAGLEEKFHECFRLSETLFNYMNNAGMEEEAQYATLLGHRMRYRFIINAREAFHIHELRTQPQGHPMYREIVKEMHRQLTEVHPHIGNAMRFVNKGEDPELTRMAAELATQRKLALLEK